MEYTLHYLNRNLCVTIPSRQTVYNYLIKSNYLSEFSKDEEKEEVLNNLGITTKLDILKKLIDNKTIEQGSIPWDNIPTLGHTLYVLSSDSIYRYLLKYYTKEEVDAKIQSLWELVINNINNSEPVNINVDSELSETSTNPVQNKVLKALLDEKVDYSILSNYATLSELNSRINSINKTVEKGKGYYSSYDSLIEAVPNPSTGDWAIVSVNDEFYIALCSYSGIWTLSNQKYEVPEIDLSEYAKKEELSQKQDLLENKVNIKSINGQSILGSGNLVIESGTGTVDSELSDTSENPVLNKVIKELLDNKVSYSRLNGEILSDYYTSSLVDSLVDLISNAKEGCKGYFTSENVLKSLYPSPSVGDWAVVNKNNKWVIATCQANGVWTITQEEYELPNIDLSEYVKKEELDTKQNALINGISIKTINGLNILGSGNILIEGGSVDLSILDNYMSKAEYDDIQNPLKTSLNAYPSLAEFTGNNVSVNLNYTVTKGGKPVMPDTLTIKVNGFNPVALLSNSSGLYTTSIITKGVTSYTLQATYNGVTSTSTAQTNLVLPSYIGFDLSASANNVDLTKLTKEIKSSVSNTKTLNNTIAGSYLWIITPYRVNTVAVDPSYTYTVSMLAPESINGLNYYRSELAVDISNLTYYVK